MLSDGWTFEPAEGVVPDPINHVDKLHQVYTAADPDYTGRVTVPILWDRETATIVKSSYSATASSSWLRRAACQEGRT